MKCVPFRWSESTMINTQPGTVRTGEAENEAVDEIVTSGAGGAKMLAGVASAAVVGLWVAFYVCVFVPRSGAP
jgi:hypothetical protein